MTAGVTEGANDLAAAPVELRVDGVAVTAPPGATVLEACDLAGRYVPRLCTYPGLHCCASCAAAGDTGAPRTAAHATECGLCVVRRGDGTLVLACATSADTGMEVVTDDEELRRLRLERLRPILGSHPFVCLLCPDRDGCSRDECTYGNPPETRCCDRYGDCELAALLAFVDPRGTLQPGAGPFDRRPMVEGPIRREPGLCVGCGRCVVVCEEMEGAGRALRMVAAPGEAGTPVGRPIASPKQTTLRDSGCTFCGRCVLVCPTGALTVSGQAGDGWLDRRRRASGLVAPILPPRPRLTLEEALARVGPHPGVLQLFDSEGEAVLISGVPDLSRGLRQAVDDLGAGRVTHVVIESEPLYTQRESELLTQYVRHRGHLPLGNDLGDDLFDDLPDGGPDDEDW